MTKKIPIIILCFSCCIIFINATKETMPGCDAPLVGGHTGAPGETACNGCHPGTLNSGPATFTFDLGTTTYVAGQTYTGTVRIGQASMPKFGFSGLALKDSTNTTIGAFSLIEAVRTRTYTDGPRKYVSHTPCGADSANANSWIFRWTAPSANVGNITLYVGLLAANHSHSTAGDFSYTSSKLLTYQAMSGINENEIKFSYEVYPNPVTDNLYISFDSENKAALLEITIYDISGKKIYYSKTDEDKLNVDISDWSKGIYYVNVKQGTSSVNKKIILP